MTALVFVRKEMRAKMSHVSVVCGGKGEEGWGGGGRVLDTSLYTYVAI